jgi:hypothetical protein
MTTKFYYPNNITEYGEQNELIQPLIGWNINGTLSPDNSITSKQPLHTISGLWMEKFLSNTNELWCTKFNIPDTELPIIGIELYLDIHRVARIEDLRIQLRLNNEYIGDNMASPVNPVQSNMYTGENSPLLPIVGNKNVYGGPTETWGTTLTNTDVSNDSFGVAISFRSTQVYPHRDLVIVNQIGLGITYG